MNYRDKYKKHYNINFDRNFDIHHLDFNHENNEMSNLLLLPKQLHEQYHRLVNALRGENGKITISCRIVMENGTNYEVQMMRQFCEVMEEIQKWKLYKVELEQYKQRTSKG